VEPQTHDSVPKMNFELVGGVRGESSRGAWGLAIGGEGAASGASAGGGESPSPSARGLLRDPPAVGERRGGEKFSESLGIFTPQTTALRDGVALAERHVRWSGRPQGGALGRGADGNLGSTPLASLQPPPLLREVVAGQLRSDTDTLTTWGTGGVTISVGHRSLSTNGQTRPFFSYQGSLFKMGNRKQIRGLCAVFFRRS